MSQKLSVANLEGKNIVDFSNLKINLPHTCLETCFMAVISVHFCS